MSSLNKTTYDNSWHLDKRVPVAIIITLFIQLVCFVFAAGFSYYQLGNHDKRIDKLEEYREKQMELQNELLQKIVRIEERLGYQNDILTQIRNSLKQR